MGMLIPKPARFGFVNAKCRSLKSDLLDPGFYEKAVGAESLGDVYALLKSTVYAQFIEDAEKESIENGLEASFKTIYRKITSVLKKDEREIFDLFFMGRKRLMKHKLGLKNVSGSAAEYRVADMEYLNSVKEALSRMQKDQRKDLSEILGSYFDILNLYTILRLKIIYKFEPEEVAIFLVPYGNVFDLEELVEISAAKTVSEISGFTHKKLGRTFSGYHEFRQALMDYHMKILHKVWYGYPFKLSVVFSLLRMKEIETKKIRSIVEGVYFRLPREEISKMSGVV